MNHVLVIAGSDPSGGAGVQADLITLKDFGVPALFAITALTAQNDQRVLTIHPTPADLLTQQLQAAVVSKEVAAAKIGMIASRSNVSALIWFLKTRKIPQVVIDPIMHSSSGFSLLEKEAFHLFRQQLLPLATVITPNALEASTLIGSNIHDEETQSKAAKQIHEEMMAYRGSAFPDRPLSIVVKGGHLKNREAVDVAYDGKTVSTFREKRLDKPSPRGTGCRFASAIAAGLAQDQPLAQAIQEAKRYLTKYIEGS